MRFLVVSPFIWGLFGGLSGVGAFIIVVSASLVLFCEWSHFLVLWFVRVEGWVIFGF